MKLGFDPKKAKKLLYPAIVLGYLLTVVLLFIGTIVVLSRAFNAALSEPKSAEGGLRVDESALKLVAKRLKLDLAGQNVLEPPAETEAPATSTPPFAKGAASSTPVVAPTPTVATSTLRVAIYNASRTSGTATKLNAALQQAGFATSTIGNRPTRAKTLIEVSERARRWEAALRTIVGSRYALEETQTTTSSQFDVIITIGTTKS